MDRVHTFLVPSPLGAVNATDQDIEGVILCICDYTCAEVCQFQFHIFVNQIILLFPAFSGFQILREPHPPVPVPPGSLQRVRTYRRSLQM